MDNPVRYERDLIEQIKHFQTSRVVEHCGNTIQVPSFDIYARCSQCDAEIKVRAFSAVTEIEDVFDAVFEWMLNPHNRAVAEERMLKIKEDLD